MPALMIQTHPPYPLIIDHQWLQSASLLAWCRTLAYRLVLICDQQVEKLYAKALYQFLTQHQLQVKLIVIPVGEQYKTREMKAWIEDHMLADGYGRDSGIIALGGGVITDLAGFVAATFCRGIPLILIPTTLLAMLDASIGGKTAVNTPLGKNLIGAFKQPKAVLIDTATLKTLPDLAYRTGVVEAIKHALILPSPLFSFLSQKVDLFFKRDAHFLSCLVLESAKIKAQVVEEDCQEQNLRQILNLGHTLGHALETACDYQMMHGDAVAYGLMMETWMAVQLGALSQQTYQTIAQLLKTYQLPQTRLNSVHLEAVMEALNVDKKNRQGQIRCVLLKAIGQIYRHQGHCSVVIQDTELIQKAVAWLLPAHSH